MDTEKVVIFKKPENITFCDLSAEWNAVVCRYVELNRHLLEINQLYEVFRFNIEQLFLGYEIGSNDCIARRPGFQSDYSDFIAINSYIMNVISAGRSLVDSVDQCMKNTYGEQADAYTDFKNNCKSAVYDSNFSYRFFYDLRNFSQHNHLPVSVENGFCCFDTSQILNTPHFKSNKNVRAELEDLQKRILEQYKDNFRISLSMCLTQYIVGVAQVHQGFWEGIKTRLFELKTAIDAAIESHPEMLEHGNERFDGCILYQEPEKEGWHAFTPYSDTDSYYEGWLKAAQDFFAESDRQYKEVEAHFKKIALEP